MAYYGNPAISWPIAVFRTPEDIILYQLPAGIAIKFSSRAVLRIF